MKLAAEARGQLRTSTSLSGSLVRQGSRVQGVKVLEAALRAARVVRGASGVLLEAASLVVLAALLVGAVSLALFFDLGRCPRFDRVSPPLLHLPCLANYLLRRCVRRGLPLRRKQRRKKKHKNRPHNESNGSRIQTMEEAVCVVEMDDGVHRHERLWRTQGAAVVLPATVMAAIREVWPECPSTLLLGIRDSMVNGFAASRCTAVFVTEGRTRRVNVNADFFYASQYVSVAGLTDAPAVQVGGRPRVGEDVWVVCAPKAAHDLQMRKRGKHSVVQGRVRAVEADRFSYDVDPLEHEEHALMESKGCAIMSGAGELLGLRLGRPTHEPTSPRSGLWSHEAATAETFVHELERYALEEKRTRLRRLEAAVADDEIINESGLRVVRHRLRKEVNEYEPGRSIDAGAIEGGPAFVARCAALRGMRVLVPLAVDFFDRDQTEAAAEIFFQTAALASKSFGDAMHAALSPRFVAAAGQALHGDVEDADSLDSAAIKRFDDREKLAAAAGASLAAVAQRADAQGLTALIVVAPDVAAALRALAAVADAQGSLVRAAQWLWGTLHAASAACRNSAFSAVLRDAQVLPALDRLLDPIKSLSRRGQVAEVDAGIRMWRAVRDLCDPGSQVASQVPSWQRLAPLDGQIAARIPESVIAARIAKLLWDQNSRPLPIDEFRAVDPSYLALRTLVSRQEDDRERPPPHALPGNEILRMVQDELCMANTASDDGVACQRRSREGTEARGPSLCG